MAYDNPQTLLEKFATMDFGATGSTTHYIVGPAGKRGNLTDIGVVLSEATVWTTTEGSVQIGTAADPDAYGKLNIPTASVINTTVNTSVDTDAVIDMKIPADTPTLLTLTCGTGGSITGQGVPYIVIDWY